MSQWQPATRQEWFRLGAVAAALVVIGSLALFGATTTADAQTSVDVDGLEVSGVNKTTTGTVSAVTLSADLSYQHNVPDATRRVVSVRVGTDNDSLESLDYRNTREPVGQTSGTVTLSGDVLESTTLTSEGLTPATASSERRNLTVVAELRIERENGEAVTRTVRDTVTISLHDGTDLTAALGGTGAVTVETSG